MLKVLQNGKQAADVLHKTDMHQAPWVTQTEDDDLYQTLAKCHSSISNSWGGRLKWYFVRYMLLSTCLYSICKSKNTAEKPKDTNPCKTQISINCTYNVYQTNPWGYFLRVASVWLCCWVSDWVFYPVCSVYRWDSEWMLLEQQALTL